MRSLVRTRLATTSYAVQHRLQNAFTTSCRVDRSPQKRSKFARPRTAVPSYRDSESSKSRGEASRTFAMFERLALSRFDISMGDPGVWGRKRDEFTAFGVNSHLDFSRESKLFRIKLVEACLLAKSQHVTSHSENPLFWSLRSAFVEKDVPGLDEALTYAFQNFVMRDTFSKNIATTQKKIADFRFPHEWFPATRALQRTIHLHVGPTNSGKTYNALKALENAKSGIYAGPLRLLAHEVYSRFLAKGKKCALITGEEMRIPEGEDMYYRSCTVEMTPLNSLVDVAVVDEIQMIGDLDRGWAWTQVLLGVQAKEVHLCGEERAVELVQSLCAAIGDKCIVHRYKRLSGLEVADTSLNGQLSNLRKGDAIVSFSRIGIHALKNDIERITGKRCAVVYGSLPPEVRAQQAALFNDPDNDYDYLAASDAIGMGLNLEIKRVVFEQTHKRDASRFRVMTVSELKQIGGRAGRFRTANHAIKAGRTEDADMVASVAAPKEAPPGLVTALEEDDLDIVRRSFAKEPEPLRSAGLQPPSAVLERFCTYFPPNTPFSYVVARLRELARLSPLYHMCKVKEMLNVSDLIQPYPMSVYDRCVFLSAPVALREYRGPQVLQAFARCVSKMEGGDLLDIAEIDLELLDIPKQQFRFGAAEYLRRLEALHKALTLYLWLSYRYSGVFRSQRLAFHVKELVESNIDVCLSGLEMDEEKRRARAASIRSQAKSDQRKQHMILGEETEDTGDSDAGEGVTGWDEESQQDPSELPQITRLERRPNKHG
ncbi:P-loop containing nucleoside triphosphate hydrolase protein [Xylariomycetidae sp. FL2044]|nr:P-loop containing nucleoside triphosphate hydrolase protein [Xylariomycetidae sp. FL2044]